MSNRPTGYVVKLKFTEVHEELEVTYTREQEITQNPRYSRRDKTSKLPVLIYIEG